MKLQKWIKDHAPQFEGELRYDEPLSKHTYYRIGGPAQVLAIPKSLNDLKFLSEAIRVTGSEFFILGLGSNILVSDEGYKGLIIKTGRLNLEIASPAECLGFLKTGASVAVSTLLRRATQDGWGGLEFL